LLSPQKGEEEQWADLKDIGLVPKFCLYSPFCGGTGEFGKATLNLQVISHTEEKNHESSEHAEIRWIS
jgi:hypothetical protein